MTNRQYAANTDSLTNEESLQAAPTVADALCTGLLAGLNHHERDVLARHARLQSFAPGVALFQEGDESADAMLLLSGLVKLCRHSSQGKECVLHLVHSGKFIDAGVLFYEGGLPISAVALQHTTVLSLNRRAFLHTLENNAPLAVSLLGAMSLRQRLLITKIAGSQGRISVAGRVAAWLLHRAKMEKSATLRLGVTQEILARLMGISRESLSRELSALSAAGIIEHQRRSITLLDHEALKLRAQG
nr:Crp/Fnr family transcriptional regulator [uncultured Desulfovibrio sp.]